MFSSIRIKGYFTYSLFVGLFTIFVFFNVSKVAAQAQSVSIRHFQAASHVARAFPRNGLGLTASATNWTMYGFSPSHTGTNPYENILNTTNVSHLVLKWTASTNYYAQSSQPAVVNGIIYYGSLDTIYAFNAQTGATLWSYTTGNLIASLPVVVNGMLYIGSSDTKLYAFHLPGL